MRKTFLKKFLCLGLVLILSIPLMPNSAGAAAPNTYSVPDFVVKNARHLTYGRPVRLTISGFTFTGRLYNEKLTSQEVEKVAERVMRDTGTTDKRFNDLHDRIAKMNEVIGFTDKDMKQVMDNILTVVGVALGGIGGAAGTIGDVLGILQGAYQLLEGHADEALDGAYEALGGKISEPAGKGYGWGKAGKMVSDEWVKSQQKYRQIRDGLEAIRELQRFFKALERELDKFIEDNKESNVISFETHGQVGSVPADQVGTFTLYGVECYERWEVKMNLGYKAPYSNDRNLKDGHYDGEYEGKYELAIVYDLSNLAEVLPDLMKTPDWQTSNAYLVSEWWKLMNDDYKYDFTLSEPGTWFLRREIEGDAIARIRLAANGEIFPAQKNDEMKSLSPAVLKMKGKSIEPLWDDVPDSFLEVEFIWNFALSDKRINITSIGGHSYYMPIDDKMWQSGDEAKWNLKLAVIRQ